MYIIDCMCAWTMKFKQTEILINISYCMWAF